MKSFTLIELLIVLVIIGILATLAIPQYENFVEKTKFSQAVTTLGAIYRAQEAYKMETGNYLLFTSDVNHNHSPAALGIQLIDLGGSGVAYGDKYFSYESYHSFGNPVYTGGWACLAIPRGWTPKIGKFLLIDFDERKIKIQKSDNNWYDY